MNTPSDPAVSVGMHTGTGRSTVPERAARLIGVLALLLALLIAVVRVWNPALWRGARVNVSLRLESATDTATDTSGRHAGDTAARRVADRIALGIVAHVVNGDAPSWPAMQALVTAVPTVQVRRVLSAAIAAGVPFSWQDSTGLSAFAVDAAALPAPWKSTIVSVVSTTTPQAQAPARGATPRATSDTAPPKLRPTVSPVVVHTALILRDQSGLLDSTGGDTAVMRLRLAQTAGTLRAQVIRDGRTLASARVVPPDSANVRRVLVVGAIGWETKFVSAALEESGWQVDGTIAVAPRTLVRVGTPTTLDTARYSAVVVLDSGLITVPVLQRFVAQGGGVVIAGNALRDTRTAAFASASVSAARPPIAGALLTDTPRRGLPALPLIANRGAYQLEREDNRPMVLVARRDVGRVLASAYMSTWRWRMEGDDDARDAHRTWWSTLVSTVAFTPRPVTPVVMAANGTPTPWPDDAAPKADMMARFGPPVAQFASRNDNSTRMAPPLWLLYLIATGAFLTEWTMRRLRGAR